MGDEGWSLLIGLDAPYYIWLARAALTILVIHGFVSVFRLSLRLEFERWRLLHNILAFSVLVLGFFHSWNAGHDLSAVPMKVLWGSLLGVAVLTYLYHRGLRPFWNRRHAYRVIDVLKEAHNVWTVKLVPPEGRKCYAYLPGQFHFLTLYRGRGLPLEEHPFTISSTPTQEGFVSSTIKVSGDFTALIGQTNPGDQAAVHGPFGRFSYVLHPDERDLVFIAGGIGITPLMSMLRHMRDSQSKRPVLLLYANKTDKDIVFGDELTTMESGELAGLTVVHILSQAGDSWMGETGRVDRQKIERLCGSISGKAFYVCGPPTMIDRVNKDLRDLGVADARIHTERFSL